VSNFALPSDLRHGIKQLASDISAIDITERAENISQNYNKGNPSRRVIGGCSAGAAYLATRLPATYAAPAAALSAPARRAPFLAPLSVLDIGSGLGTASWAVVARWPVLNPLRWLTTTGPCCALRACSTPARAIVLRAAGTEIAAPCPHARPCPILSRDWCHFGQLLARSRGHMRAKGAKLPFEVETFSYLALSRGVSLDRPKARIIVRPRAAKFGGTFRLCGETDISERLVPKRDRQSYRDAAHKKWGDTLPI
jgi:ribosomal protein RSM22 (predicted rRNA methylase)